jgi:hypothetical protein
VVYAPWLCIGSGPAPPFSHRIIALSVPAGARNTAQLATAATNGIKTSCHCQASQKPKP